VGTLIGSARAVVVPSLWPEPAGMVAIEAALHGRATIANAVGGLPEIVIDGVTGLVVPPGDIGALARALDRLLRNPLEAAAMGAAAAERGAVLYSVETHVERLHEIYAQAST
ncbi:MAG: glycosyltransferase, partial [Actinomycetota bacterium]|nr:glycosyltransferase [Actinomycetota bacterium]